MVGLLERIIQERDQMGLTPVTIVKDTSRETPKQESPASDPESEAPEVHPNGKLVNCQTNDTHLIHDAIAFTCQFCGQRPGDPCIEGDESIDPQVHAIRHQAALDIHRQNEALRVQMREDRESQERVHEHFKKRDQFINNRLDEQGSRDEIQEAREAADPRKIPCPHCHAKAGSRCKRPSGHQAPSFHRDRIGKSEVEAASKKIQELKERFAREFDERTGG